ncbi:MAG: electron transfer flavoprotein subunit alpha/FixB family protein [Candidatus Kariarchaeaceae archaeon]|jgi:electron transfer flavoprotein alpha subunit
MVLVIAEIDNGEFKDSTYELIKSGKDLATGLGTSLKLLVLGSGMTDKMSNLGMVDEVINVDDPSLSNFVSDVWAPVVTKVAEEKAAKAVLVSYSTYGIDVSAYVAGSLGMTHIGYCTGLSVEGGNIVANSLMFGGKLNASTIADGPVVLSMQPGAANADDGKQDGSPTVTTESLSKYAVSSKITFKIFHMPDTSDVDIASQDILVSVGRGIAEESNIELAQELAEAMGGTVSGSRPIIDSGWLPKTRQVGKSGKQVKPKLYLALGISGAPEHVEGMGKAELIVAVNTDENAPIFSVAHYGIVADLFDFAEEMTDALG